jgi:site-specific DNA-cytosine methylase
MEGSTGLAIRVVEFFSGIGGWRCALDYCEIPFTIVEAFDINPAANAVYQHNFGSSPSSVSTASKYQAHIIFEIRKASMA